MGVVLEMYATADVNVAKYFPVFQALRGLLYIETRNLT
jgi:hypothetical protein